MNMQITDAYILDMNKDELRNFLYYNLDYSSFKIKIWYKKIIII